MDVLSPSVLFWAAVRFCSSALLAWPYTFLVQIKMSGHVSCVSVGLVRKGDVRRIAKVVAPETGVMCACSSVLLHLCRACREEGCQTNETAAQPGTGIFRELPACAPGQVQCMRVQCDVCLCSGMAFVIGLRGASAKFIHQEIALCGPEHFSDSNPVKYISKGFAIATVACQFATMPQLLLN